MSECTDKRFRKSLHSYELGLLEGEELLEFERHLFDCEECFNEVREFHRASQHLLRNRDVTDVVREFVREDSAPRQSRKLFSFPKPLRVLIPIAAVFLIVLVLKPWNIEIQPTREAIAAENRMLITCFEDLTGSMDSPQLGEVVASLLLVDLTESHYVQVVSRERLFHALSARNIDGSCPPDRATAYGIAREIGVRWLLTGTIIQRQPNLILASELVDVPTGNAMAAQRIVGDPKDDIFSLVDKLTVEVKRDLLLPSDAMSEFDPDLSDLTTDSPEAYRLYLEGVVYSNKMFYPEAVESFRAALQHDSTFAMVYYRLAGLLDGKLIYRALEYATDASPRERYYIESRAALYDGDLTGAIGWAEKIVERYPGEAGAYNLLGNYYYGEQRFEKALEYYTLATAEDPQYGLAWNQLAYCHARLGNLHAAIDAINRYIDLTPDEPNPYDSKTEILSLFGDLDGAINALLPATEEETSFLEPLSRMGLLLTFRGDFERADICFRQITSQVDDERYWWVTLYRASMMTRQGRFGEARSILDSVVAAYRKGEVPHSPGTSATSIRAALLREIGELGVALTSIEHTVQIGNEAYPDLSAGFQNHYIRLVAEAGDTSAVTKMLGHLKLFADQRRMEQSCYFTSKGYVEFALEYYDSAVHSFEQAASRIIDPMAINWYENNYMLALSHLKAREYDAAIAGFEKIQRPYTYERLLHSVYDVQSHYYLGIAFEESGQSELAVSQYVTFLDLWGDADRELPAIVDAKERLERLRSAS